MPPTSDQVTTDGAADGNADSPSNPSRRIIYVHGSLAMGGAEVLRLSVLEEVICRPELSVRVCVLRDRGVLADQVEKLGIPLDVLGNRGGLFDLFGILRLARYLRKHRPDIAQSSQFLTNMQTRLASWLARVPAVIIEEHGIYRWKRWYHRAIDRWINRGATAVVACSHCVARSAAGHLGRDESSITVIHNCASRSHFRAPAENDSMRKKLAGEASLVVGTVGTLRWEKGHRYLLQAWQQLHADGSIPCDAKLLIVGAGPLESQLRQTAAKIPGVVFLGRRDDTEEFLRSIDLFVLPSINEGFGIAIVEAMCAGLPIVSTRSGGIPEVIDTGRTGILVAPEDSRALADAIAKLAGDPQLRNSLARAAKTEAEKRFHPSRYADELAQLYQSLSMGAQPIAAPTAVQNLPKAGHLGGSP